MMTQMNRSSERFHIAAKLLDLNQNGVALGAAAGEFIERVTGQPATAIV